MSSLRVINAHPSEPPSDEEVIRVANQLLREFNIPTAIEDIGEICAALFVLLYENLFSDRLPGIIRLPVTKEDEIHNCQTVIDILSSDIVCDSLSHIRGVDVVEGDKQAISNLLDIFSYLLDFVVNKIDSDVPTDNEDCKSFTNEEQESDFSSKVTGMKLNPNRSPQYSRSDLQSRRRDYDNHNDDLFESKGLRSPENKNENQSLHKDFKRPPSPISADLSASLLGQKTVDSTDLELQYGKENTLWRGSPYSKASYKDDENALNERFGFEDESRQEEKRQTNADIDRVAAVNGLDSAPVTLHGSSHYIFTHHLYHHYDRSLFVPGDLEPEGLNPTGRQAQFFSATVPPSHQNQDQDVHFSHTVGPINYKTSCSSDEKYLPDRNQSPPRAKEVVTNSYNDLRYLVERTAAMTRKALETSPVLGRLQRGDSKITDSTNSPRPTISSDGARLAKELNAKEMRRGEPSNRKEKKDKKVAFSYSAKDGYSARNRPPLEELSDNDVATSSMPKGSHSHGGLHKSSTDYGTADQKDVDPRIGILGCKSSEQLQRGGKRNKKGSDGNQSSGAFAKHLARSRQPELGAAHYTLQTEDRAMKKKQDFLERLYQEDFGEFSEDVKVLMNKDKKESNEKEKEMLKSYEESRPPNRGAKKNKNSSSKLVSSKKAKMGEKVVNSSKMKKSSSTPRVSDTSCTSPVTLKSEEDLLPLLLNEFPHLHLSDHTWHELCRKGLQQIESVSRVYHENRRKKSKAQIQLEEAAQRHELLSDIMKKELEHTKRMREIKEQRVQQLQVKNKTHEKRVQSARARRYYNEYQVNARSKQLKRRTREEQVFRDLFKDAMKIQKERIKDIRQYATDQRKTHETRRQNEMESLENFYQDQFKILAEKLSRERKETSLRDQAQQQMVDRAKRELRKKIESEISQYQEQIFRNDDHTHFRQMDADRVKKQLHTARYAAQI